MCDYLYERYIDNLNTYLVSLNVHNYYCNYEHLLYTFINYYTEIYKYRKILIKLKQWNNYLSNFNLELHNTMINIFNRQLDIYKVIKITKMYEQINYTYDYKQIILFIQLDNYELIFNEKTLEICEEFKKYMETFNIIMKKGLIIKEQNNYSIHIIIFADIDNIIYNLNCVYKILIFEEEIIKYIIDMFNISKKYNYDKYQYQKTVSQIILHNDKNIKSLLKQMRPFYYYFFELYVNNNTNIKFEKNPEIIIFYKEI
jgi:hypothetical protein